MSEARELYHQFVVERHRIWERRLAGLPAPWSTDAVLRVKKFTNVYRALDAGSQFLIKELLEGDEYETLLRCFLYRYTNRPEPWVAWIAENGEPPHHGDLKSGRLRTFWADYQASGLGLFSPAYQMFVGAENKGMNRLDWVLRLTTETFCSSGEPLINQYVHPSMTVGERVVLLQQLPRCGPFMAMQITTDYGYSRHAQADENEFILPGPGARAGVKVFAPGEDAEAVIREVTGWWRNGEVSLFGRPLSLMDVQNTFCEFSKYERAYRANQVAGTERGHYRGHGDLPEPVLPAHWELTTCI